MHTTSRTTRLAGIAAVAASLLVLSACGGASTITAGAGTPSSGASAVAGIDAEYNDADIAFITDMKPHHEGAIMMAGLAETRAESAEVKELASRIVDAQDPEIEMMNKMAMAWGVDLESGGDHDMSAIGESPMAGTDEGAAALEMLSGAEFDREFLTMMTVHHEAAVEMAKTELSDGMNPQAKQMASDIIASQTAEIAEMQRLLAAL